MLDTFNALEQNEREKEQENALSEMAENNTSVDIPALINRINSLEKAVEALQSAKVDEPASDNVSNKSETEIPTSGKNEESEDKEE